MTWSPVAPLVLLWWNTALSPPVAKSRATDEDRAFVVAQIKSMREELRFDILGLGEVSTEDLEMILDGVGDPALSVLDTTNRSNRVKFDTALIYDRTTLIAGEPVSLTDVYAKSTLKLGQMLSFMAIDGIAELCVVISHWPSRRSVSELQGKRSELGMLLRQSIMPKRAEGADPYIVLMGDYNDDPFSPSLASHLLATRDRELARRNSDFFYNPFWRHLGESLHATAVDNQISVGGTHFFRNGDETEWYTYDQIIFSSAFLNDGPMLLEEKYSQIIVTSELRRRLLARRHVCDHLPVMSVVTLRERQ
jgi:hypothetical protein